MPDLARLLQQHLRTIEAERGLPRQGDYVFTASTGQPLNYRNVSVRGLDKAADVANLNPGGKPGSPSTTSATPSAATSP
jgi:hypothetical protein